MNYDTLCVFLTRQRRISLATSIPGAIAISAAAWMSVLPTIHLVWPLLATILSLALVALCFQIPNYLGLDANPRRRIRWHDRARGAFELLLAGVVIFTRAWSVLLLLAAIVVLYLLGRGRLLRAIPAHPMATAGPGLTAYVGTYFVLDLAVFFVLHRSGVPGFLLAALLVLSAFLATTLLLIRSESLSVAFGLVVGGIAALFGFGSLASLGVFFVVAGAACLTARADRRNLQNYGALVRDLQEFRAQTVEEVVRNLAEANNRLIANWQRELPKGAASLESWYSRNALDYLYANTQHHLLYRHITYTLGLLELARGRCLDFGGGPGSFSCALAAGGLDVTYLDVPGESADFLRWRAAREGLRVAIVHDLGSLRAPFDTLFALDVLEHIEDVRSTIARWTELLVPHGRLIATYFNGPVSSAPMHLDPGFDAKTYLLANGFRDIKPGVVHFYSPALLRKSHFMVLEKVGA